MKPLVILLFCFLSVALVRGQQVETIVPRQSLMVGTAFQVQYVVKGAAGISIEQAPSFNNFQLVSGPHSYTGKSVVNGVETAVENIVYTLVPLGVGNFDLESIRLRSGDQLLESKAVSVNVIMQPGMSFNVKSSYTDVSLYAPSSKKDLDRIIKEDIFIRTEVDRTSCFEGEPVVATFKLYSRLQSTSEVIKSPGFYGFSAVDMLDINSPHNAVETIRGSVFNTSILRKVQLYPVQSGRQMIDPMRVRNVVEFRDSLNDARRIEVENELSTPEVAIYVKPLPKGKPSNFTGAVGKFSIMSALEKDHIGMNEQGKLFVTIAGSGNFIQFGPPALTWPDDIEVFELPYQEQLNKRSAPLSGRKTYVFGFSARKQIMNTIEPVSFSYFNPSSGSYHTITTDTIRFELTSVAPKVPRETDKKNSVPDINWKLVSALLLTAILASLLYAKRKKTARAPVRTARDFAKEISELKVDEMNDKQAAYQIRQVICDYLKERFDTADTAAVKDKMPSSEFNTLTTLLAECEFVGYTNMESSGSRKKLKEMAMRFLEKS